MKLIKLSQHENRRMLLKVNKIPMVHMIINKNTNAIVIAIICIIFCVFIMIYLYLPFNGIALACVKQVRVLYCISKHC